MKNILKKLRSIPDEKIEKYLTVSIWIMLVLMALPLLHYGRRALICDSFTIKGHSMDPTLHQGQKVYVNKLIMGARIYKCYDFSTDTLACFRLPGLRKLRVGDIAVFNYPYGWQEDKIGFRINYVYAKRCLGVPGDSIRIVNSHYVNSNTPVLGINADNERKLKSIEDSVLLDMWVLKAGHFAGKTEDWTIKDFGPVYVPGKGTEVLLDDENLSLYRNILQFEIKDNPDKLKGHSYTFRYDYYFFGGDNVIDSKDSRYIGLVPEPFVIGVVRLNT